MIGTADGQEIYIVSGILFVFLILMFFFFLMLVFNLEIIKLILVATLGEQ